MTTIQFYALLGAAQIALLGGAHWTGRLVAARNCEAEKAASAGQVIDRKNEDDEKQGEAASASDAALRREIAVLRRKLESAYVPTGLDCDAPGSGDSVHDAYDEIFGERLPAGAGGDGAGK